LVSNDEVCALIDSTDEWVRRRSGIVSRRFAGPDEDVVAMAVAAGTVALAEAGLAASRIDTVIVATMSHLEQTPAAAPQVADRLGSRAAAFDVNAACSGFCVALGTADALVRSGTAEYVLVVGADKMTDIIDPRDRSTAFLFGDGAGAVVVGPGDSGISPVAWNSDGSGKGLIAHSAPWTVLRDDPAADWPTMEMSGQSVFRWATREVPVTARAALKLAGITADELAAFIPHQANIRITEAIARSLELPGSVVLARDVVTAGNTSAASIPLAMEQLLTSGEVESGGLALLVGFGAGLTQAAQVVELP
jgi:3-oxoacyl-[acyl-carrier-protein] synthase-3